MDFYRNVTVSGDYHHPEQVLASPSCSKLGTVTPTGSLDDLFSAQNTEVDVSMEWLSVFVEDCLSSTVICLPPAPISATSAENTNTTPSTTTKPSKPLEQKFQKNPSNSLEKFIIPGRARSKRKRITNVKTRNPLSSWCYSSHQTLHFPTSDPPLLHHQAYWLADSELVMPKKEPTTSNNGRDSEVQEEEEEEEEKVTTASTNNNSKENLGIFEGSSSGQQQPRRCTHCLAQRTPQWRAGPLGPKTLCNACGVRYKSGRLLPEYRPAKSPTFVSYLHSNSHKRVLEMRMASTSSAAAAFNS